MSQPPLRRPDASMTLLTQLMDRPLDPGYAAAAARRRADGVPDGRPERSARTLAILVLLGLLLAAAALQTRGQSTTRIAERDRMIAQITSQDAVASGLQRANLALQARIEAERARQLDQQSQGALADRITQLGVLTGAVSVTGPGILLTVNDAPASVPAPGSDPRASAAVDNGRVLDQDLQLVVNGLWASGAEAVSINGQRLTALSAIRSAGQAILVDYRPLAPPYAISAIGDPNQLPATFSDSPGGRNLKYLADNFGIRYNLTTSTRLVLPASAGLDIRQAQPVTPPAAVTAPPVVTSP